MHDGCCARGQSEPGKGGLSGLQGAPGVRGGPATVPQPSSLSPQKRYGPAPGLVQGVSSAAVRPVRSPPRPGGSGAEPASPRRGSATGRGRRGARGSGFAVDTGDDHPLAPAHASGLADCLRDPGLGLRARPAPPLLGSASSRPQGLRRLQGGAAPGGSRCRARP